MAELIEIDGLPAILTTTDDVVEVVEAPEEVVEIIEVAEQGPPGAALPRGSPNYLLMMGAEEPEWTNAIDGGTFF